MKRMVSFVLCLTLLLSVVLFPAYAQDISDEGTDEQ